MNQCDSWQLSKFQETYWRMPYDHEVVVGVEGASPRAWLDTADIVVGQHRTQCQARWWITSVHRRYPSCLLAVAWQREGRWCLLGCPAANNGSRFDLAAAQHIGRVVYQMLSARSRQL